MLLTPAEIKPKSFESKRTLFILPGVDASHVHVRALALGCFYSHISTRTFRRALTASLDSWQSLEEGAGKRCSECESSPHLSMVSARVSSSGE